MLISSSLQGEWTIGNSQSDDFVLVPDNIGLEGAVINLCCYSAEEVLAMHQREEIMDALSEMVNVGRDELTDLSQRKEPGGCAWGPCTVCGI